MSHDGVPDGGGTGNSGSNMAHGGVVIVADPNPNQVILGVADGPIIAEVVSGASFDGNLMTFKV